MKKAKPFFPSNSPLKDELLWSPPFLKIWLEVQNPLSPAPPPTKRGGVVHIMVAVFMLMVEGAKMTYSSNFCFKYPMKLKLGIDDHHNNWS